MRVIRFTLLAAASLSLAGALQAAPAAGVRHETIFDPNFKMTAFDVNVPANWKFDGAYFAGSSCEQIPFPVFRIYSPDGLTEVRRYPRLDWTWTNSPFKGAPHPDCLNLKQDLTAQEFMKYIMGVLQVSYVRDAPVPQAMIDAKQKGVREQNAHNVENAKILRMQPMVRHFDFASAFAEYRNGSFIIEEHLSVGVDCLRSPLASAQQKDLFAESCSANVRAVRAPKGQLAGVLTMIDTDNIGAGANMQWVQRYLQAAIAKSNAMAQQRQQDFERSQAIRAQQHQQFLANMQAGTDRSMANARAIANSNHAIAQDWCDYALDRQTVTGPGGTVKVSNAYTHTWTDGSGRYYQTNDPNTNPNGSLPGNWTQTQKVHGDGTPQ